MFKTLESKSIIEVLKTQSAILAVLALALVAQMPHAASVFNMIVSGDHSELNMLSRLHGYSYAIALELAVLLFVVQNRQIESYGFAVVSVLVNLSYYYLNGVNLFNASALPAYLVSIALPTAIALYSHSIVEHKETGKGSNSAELKNAQPSITLNNHVHVQSAHVEIEHEPIEQSTFIEHERASNVKCETFSIEPAKNSLSNAQTAKPVNPRKQEFFMMLERGDQFSIGELANNWNVVTNTLRNWKREFEKVAQ